MTRFWATLRSRAAALFHPNRLEDDLSEELEFHLAMQTRENIAKGIPETEATASARAQLGAPAALVRDDCRDQRRLQWIETLFQDLRYAIRGLKRAPLFALTVAATIGLGLGVNTALFTILNAYVLRPVDVPDPYSLYEVHWMRRGGETDSFKPETYARLRELGMPTFSATMASRQFQTRLNNRQAFGEMVSGEYFRMLGVQPALGRVLAPTDASAVVLSYQAWKNLLAGDPEIVGKKVFISGYPVEVAGVAREGFSGLLEVPIDFWTPLDMSSQLDPDRPRILRLTGRLRSDATPAQAEAAISLQASQLTEGLPEADRPIRAILRSRATNVPISPQAIEIMLPIIAAFGLVLLIACANVMNMMLARATARQREIGIRLSLGAARARLIRQLVTESAVLALPAVALGFVISEAMLDGALGVMWATIPSEFREFIRLAPLGVDLRVFAFAMAAGLLSALLFGLVPAIRATRISVVQSARGDFGNEFRPSRLRNGLVVLQIAACATLLIASIVLLRAAGRIGDVSTGLRTHDVIDLEIRDESRTRVLPALATEPVVEKIAASAEVPLDAGFPGVRAARAGDPNTVIASFDKVSPEFFDVFGIQIRRGRGFTNNEATSAAPVAIVSETLARLLWPDASAIGQTIHVSRDKDTHRPGAPDNVDATVIGVSSDILTGLIDSESQRTFVYFPADAYQPRMVLALRVRGDVEVARQRIDELLTRTDPRAIQYIHKMDQFKAGRVYPFQVAWWLSLALGVLALLLAATGVYGVLSYLVTQRGKELGIRMALGASAGEVVGLVVRQAARLAATGLAIAAAPALGVSRLLAAQFVLVDGFDFMPYAAAMVVIAVSTLLAASVPAWRAGRIDPMTTLRCD